MPRAVALVARGVDPPLAGATDVASTSGGVRLEPRKHAVRIRDCLLADATRDVDLDRV